MRILLLPLISLTLLLSACAPTARFPAGEALLRGETPPAVAAPESLRAALELTGFERGRKTTVSAAFSAVPGRKYKLDVFGLPGMVEAAFLWLDTGWTLVIYEREGYLRGYGDEVDLPGLAVGAAPVHDLFGFLWGDFFPRGARGAGTGTGTPAARKAGDSASGGAAGPEVAGSEEGRAADSAGPVGKPGGAGTGLLPVGFTRGEDGTLRYRSGGAEWVVRLDPRTGVVREAARADSAFRMLYEGWRIRNGRPMPTRARLLAGTRPLLEIAVESVEDRPAWRRDPFRVKIPKGFSPLR